MGRRALLFRLETGIKGVGSFGYQKPEPRRYWDGRTAGGGGYTKRDVLPDIRCLFIFLRRMDVFLEVSMEANST
jgi:hypothetical protein